MCTQARYPTGATIPDQRAAPGFAPDLRRGFFSFRSVCVEVSPRRVDPGHHAVAFEERHPSAGIALCCVQPYRRARGDGEIRRMFVENGACPHAILDSLEFQLQGEPGVHFSTSSNNTYVISSAPTRVVVDKAEAGPGEPAPALGLPLLRPGELLGSFRLIRLLGQGAQGEVWKAYRPGPSRRIVAIKVLSPMMARQPNRLAQFRREASRGFRLNGPALLRVLEFDESQGLPYMVMPYVRGISLLQVIRCGWHFAVGSPRISRTR